MADRDALPEAEGGLGEGVHPGGLVGHLDLSMSARPAGSPAPWHHLSIHTTTSCRDGPAELQASHIPSYELAIVLIPSPRTCHVAFVLLSLSNRQHDLLP